MTLNRRAALGLAALAATARPAAALTPVSLQVAPPFFGRGGSRLAPPAHAHDRRHGSESTMKNPVLLAFITQGQALRPGRAVGRYRCIRPYRPAPRPRPGGRPADPEAAELPWPLAGSFACTWGWH